MSDFYEDPALTDSALAGLRAQSTSDLIAGYRAACTLAKQLADVLCDRYLEQGGDACPDADLKAIVEQELDTDPPGLA